MVDELEEQITAELADQASRLPEAAPHLTAVQLRSRQRQRRRRVATGVAYGVAAVGIASAAGALAIAAGDDLESAIVAGSAEVTAVAMETDPPTDKSGGSVSSQPPTTGGDLTDGDLTTATNLDTSRSNGNESASPTSEPDQAEEGEDPTTTSKSASSVDEPLSSETGLGANSLVIPPIPDGYALAWDVDLNGRVYWQQWEGAQGCSRRIDLEVGFVGDAVCFDYTYEQNSWAVVTGTNDDSVAWFALNPVGEKLTADVMLSDGTSVAGSVAGGQWVIDVDYSGGAYPRSARPVQVLLTSTAGNQVISLPSIVTDAPGSTITLTAAQIAG